MKKTYVKPQIVFDSFELSQSIAAGCRFLSNHEYGACALDPGDGVPTIFADSSICDYIKIPGEYNEFCHHNPDDQHSVFSS